MGSCSAHDLTHATILVVNFQGFAALINCTCDYQMVQREFKMLKQAFFTVKYFALELCKKSCFCFTNSAY